ncbi:MAG: hypothetical protein RL660_1832 [Bacteroidota bacterium]|jgi:hypothetical protein
MRLLLFFTLVVVLANCNNNNQLDPRSAYIGNYNGSRINEVIDVNGNATRDTSAVEVSVVGVSTGDIVFATPDKQYGFAFSNGIFTSRLASDPGGVPTLTISNNKLTFTDLNIVGEQSIFIDASR